MDWIENFVIRTEGLWSPPIFRKWAGIATIAGVLQRRVWTELQTGTCYPNLYTMLTGGPTSGKSLAINEVRKLWGSVRGLAIGPDNPTKASLVKRLSMSVRALVNGAAETAEPYVFTSLAVPCREFGNLISKYDNEFLAMLSDIYDNPPTYDVPRASVESFVLEKPNMTIIAGVTPDTLGTTFPEIAWGQGFTSRLVFIYSEKPKVDASAIFQKKIEPSTTELSTALASMYDIYGEMVWTPEAMNGLIDWFETGMLPEPTHNRLKFYNGRRFITTVKLSMIAAISAGRDMRVMAEDLERAQSWLLEAEAVMPDVFRAMGQKSDLQVIADMHFYIDRLWGRRELAKRAPIEDEVLWEHLADRVPSERIPRIIEAAERGGWIRRALGSGGRPRWIPRPLNEINTKLE